MNPPRSFLRFLVFALILGAFGVVGFGQSQTTQPTAEKPKPKSPDKPLRFMPLTPETLETLNELKPGTFTIDSNLASSVQEFTISTSQFPPEFGRQVVIVPPIPKECRVDKTEDLEVVRGPDIANQLRRGEPVYEKCKRIEGDILPAGPNVKRDPSGRIQVESPIVFELCVFPSGVKFKDVFFAKAIRFSETVIEGGLQFEHAVLNDPVGFEGIDVKGPVHIQETAVKRGLYFSASRDRINLIREIYVKGLVLEGPFQLTLTRIGTPEKPGNATFETISGKPDKGALLLFDSEIFGPAQFGQWKKTLSERDFSPYFLYLDGVHFHEGASFRAANLQGGMRALRTTFDKGAEFFNVQLDGGLYWHRTDSSRDIRFEGVSINDFTVLDCVFLGISFGPARDERDLTKEIPSQVNGKFQIIGGYPGTLKIPWSIVEKALSAPESHFEELLVKLAADYKSLGWFRDARQAYNVIRERALKRLSWKHEFPDKLQLWLSFNLCGFGDRPWIVLYWWAGTILLFMIIWMTKNAIDFSTDTHSYRWLDALWFSLNAFIPVGPVRWQPGAQGWPRMSWGRFHIRVSIRYRHWFLLEKLLGWFLMTVFAASMASYLIR
jgi:hypothetical protein